jgi:hypothetical protein
VRCKPKIGWCGWLSHQSQLIVKELFLQKLLVIHLAIRRLRRRSDLIRSFFAGAELNL